MRLMVLVHDSRWPCGSRASGWGGCWGQHGCWGIEAALRAPGWAERDAVCSDASGHASGGTLCHEGSGARWSFIDAVERAEADLADGWQGVGKLVEPAGGGVPAN